MERDGGVIIPNGNFVLKNGDQVTFLATQEKANRSNSNTARLPQEKMTVG